MNLIQLKYFYNVCKFQSVSDAAQYLHISQPSLSNAIKELESEFGVVLFNRHHRGMALTPEGEILFKMSKEILNSAQQAESIMRDLGKERKKLRLGIPPMIGSIILPDIYNDFHSKNDDIVLEIEECGRQELVRKLSEDYLDMVFLPHNQPLDKSLSVQHVAKLEIVCCATKNNPISKCDNITPEMLSNTPLVLFENSFFQTEEIKKWFTTANVCPNILLQTEQLSTMLSVISNGTAAGFMFREIIEKNNELTPVSLKSPIYVDISLVWKKEAYPFSSMQKFRDYVSKKMFNKR